MSIFEALREQARPQSRSTHPPSMADDAMLRAVGVIVLLGIGAMHFLQIVTTFQGTPLLGAAYLVLIAATLLVAAGLICRGSTWAWAAAGMVGAGAVAGYIFTRLLNTPLDNQDLGNWSCMLGLASLYVETSLLLLSGYALAAKRSARDVIPVRVPAESGRERSAA